MADDDPRGIHEPPEPPQAEAPPEPPQEPQTQEPAQAEAPADAGAGDAQQLEENVQSIEPEKPPMVPLPALTQERNANRALRQEMASLREELGKFAGLEEQVKALREEGQQPNVQEQLNQDPIGTLFNQIQDLSQKVEGAEAQRTQDTQRQEAEKQFRAAVAADVDAFRQQTPDYDAALDHMFEARSKEIQLLGYTEQQARQAIAKESMEMAGNAIRQGMSPAAFSYEMAKLRGYTPTQPQQQQAEQQSQQALETIQQGQQAAGTLSGTPGSGTEGTGLKDVLDMTDSEFEKHFENVRNAARGTQNVV